MTAPLTAGARVRIVIESTVESLDSGDMRLTNGITLTSTDPAQLDWAVTVQEMGWEPGDVVNDGHDNLLRVVVDGIHRWQRPDGAPTYDDETNLASLTVITRANTTPESST